MITAVEAVRVGRSLLGTPYSTYDCINFIKAICRQATGGEKKYTTAGTNTLWRSRDLIWKQENLNSPRMGMLAFKVSGEDIHHVGLVTGPDTVIHSSSAKGCVVETNLLNGQWHYLARHRLIVPLDDAGNFFDLQNEGAERMEAETGRARIATESGSLRIRQSPETGRVLGQAPKGAEVSILAEGTWPKIRYNGITGYVLGSYLERMDGDTDSSTSNSAGVAGSSSDLQSDLTTIISLEDGRMLTLLGRWRIAED